MSTESITDYLLKVKGLAESITSVVEEISKPQLIPYVLDELNSNYHVVLTTISSVESKLFKTCV